MRVVVVGAGVMGLSAARVLAERGHDVLALDRFGAGNPAASSSGLTRIWRLAHPDRPMVRLARRTTAAWRALEQRTGRTLLLESGLLWRGGDAAEVYAAMTAEGEQVELVDAAEQARRFPELLPDDERPVAWQPEAGAVLAHEALAVELELFSRASGTLTVGEVVHDIEAKAAGGVRVVGEQSTFDADVAILAAGPWATELLPRLGIELALEPVLEQVSYVQGPPGWEQRPCVIDDFTSHGNDAFYSLPTPGVGYKIGIDTPVRPWSPDDHDRTPDPERIALTEALVAQKLPGFSPHVLRSEVCSWTASTDELFVFDRVGDIVIGTGDSGQGFKFLPLIGDVLADLAEGIPVDDDVAQFSLRRFQ